jgi:hypothetical protein
LAPHSIYDLFTNLTEIFIKDNEWLDVKCARMYSTIYEINICIWMADTLTGGYKPFFMDNHQSPYNNYEGATFTAHILFHQMGLASETIKGTFH